MRISRLFLIAVLAFAAFAAARPAAAVTDGCFGLSAADCKPLADASANIASIKSFTFAYNLTISGTATGSASMMNMSAAATPDALATAEAVATPTTVKINSSVKGMGSITSATGADPISAISAQVSVEPSADMTNGKASTILLTLVNGNLFIERSGEQPLGIGLAQTGPGLLEAYAAPVASANTDFLNVLSAPGAITIVRTANSPDVGGQKQIEYVYTLNANALLDSKELVAFLRTSASLSPIPGSGLEQFASMTDEEITAQLATYKDTLKNLKVTVTRWVGTQDNQFHALVFQVTGDLNQQGNSLTGLNANFTVTLDKINQPVTITAPDVPVTDLAVLINQIFASMTGSLSGSPTPDAAATAAPTAAATSAAPAALATAAPITAATIAVPTITVPTIVVPTIVVPTAVR